MTATPSGAISAGSCTNVCVLSALPSPSVSSQHDDAIAFGLAGVMRAVANAFRDPDAAVSIDVDVGRVVQQRRRGPQRDLEPLRHLEELDRDPRGSRRKLAGLCGSRTSLASLQGCRTECLLGDDDGQHQHEHHPQL